MNEALKQTLIVAAKNAVNAAILAGIQVYHDPMDNNWHTRHGLYGIAWIIGSAIVAREGMIWIPKLLKWSTTP